MTSAALAFDLGAGSGRAILGELKDGRLAIRELHRFPNDPVQVGNRLHWDVLRLFHEIKQGLLKAKHEGIALGSIGIDSWAVDFGFIGNNGELLGNPYHYRDHHTNGVMEEVCERIGRERIFGKTGLQFLPFNSIYQLAALKKAGSPLLERADKLLMIPDLLRYFLTGEMKSEFTNASTTQLYNALNGAWDSELIQELGLEPSLFAEVVQPGTIVGKLSDAVCSELGIPATTVVAVGEHDTGSAVAGTPGNPEGFAYLICGTWSLLGTEVQEPVMTPQALEWNFTNEGGVFGTYRLLRNIMGLWLIQECRRAWEKAGISHSYAELVALAEQAEPLVSLIDPDDPGFLNPPSMPEQIAAYCRKTGQPVPESHGAVFRCIMESLALKYRLILERTEKLSGHRYQGLNMVGGGIQNELLCRFTANAIGRPVWAGPIEASAIGNLMLQWIAQGQVRDMDEARSIIRSSFPMVVYEPQDCKTWDEAYARLLKLVG
jgi:rhamnulokinase